MGLFFRLILLLLNRLIQVRNDLLGVHTFFPCELFRWYDHIVFKYLMMSLVVFKLLSEFLLQKVRIVLIWVI